MNYRPISVSNVWGSGGFPARERELGESVHYCSLVGVQESFVVLGPFMETCLVWHRALLGDRRAQVVMSGLGRHGGQGSAIGEKAVSVLRCVRGGLWEPMTWPECRVAYKWRPCQSNTRRCCCNSWCLADVYARNATYVPQCVPCVYAKDPVFSVLQEGYGHRNGAPTGPCGNNSQRTNGRRNNSKRRLDNCRGMATPCALALADLS